MSMSVSDVLENAFAEWFDGDEFESHEDFVEAVDQFVEVVIDEVDKVAATICRMTTEELADWFNVQIKDESEDEDE